MTVQALSSKRAYVAVADTEYNTEYEEARHPKNDGLHHPKSSIQLDQDQWKPFSLRPTGLISFAIVLVCILTVLIALWFYAKAHQGFSLITTNHYTWTFGPTTIFILAISYWRLVDYHSKALSPWAELAHGPSSADRTLSLDYVSPLLATTFWLASKRRHYAVCVGISGFLILKLIIVASTGLFLRETITVGPVERVMRQTSRFDTRTNFSDATDPGASAFYEAYAIMQLGLPLPSGLTHELLYETHAPPTDKVNANATYLVRSSAFVPHTQCDLVDIEPLIDWEDFRVFGDNLEAVLQVQNTSLWTCPAEAYTRNGTTYLSATGVSVQFTNVDSRLAPPRQLLSSFQTIKCNHTDQSEADPLPYLVALSDTRSNQTFNVTTANVSVGELLEPVAWSVEVEKVTGMLCTLDYDMMAVDVLYNTSLIGNQVQSVSLVEVSDPSRLQNLPNRYLFDRLGYASPGFLSGARDMFGIFTQFEYAEEPPHTVLTMVAERAGMDFKQLVDQPPTFKEATEYVLNHVILQLAKQAIVVPETNSTFVPQQASSQEHYDEEKLLMQQTSFLVIVAGIAVLLMLTAAMPMLRPCSSTCANPESVSTQLAILKASDSLKTQMQRLAIVSEKSAKSVLDQSRYQIDMAGSSISVCSAHDVKAPSDSLGGMPIGPQEGYTPFTLSRAFLGITLLSAPLAIGILEGLQRSSDSGFAGIATMNTDDSFLVSLYSRFLPALLALLIATMYNCLDFNTLVLAPYNRLVSERGSSEDFGTPITAHVAPVAIWIALKRHYWAAALTGLGALIGSVLTIIVSGLYTVENVPSPREVLVSQGDSWNVSFVQGLQNDKGATAVSSLVESTNLSYPQFTYDELAFPALRANIESTGNVAVIAPALRADLSCEELPWESSNTSWGNEKGGSPNINFNITVPLPEKCHFGSCHGNESFIRPTLLRTGLGIDNTTYYAQVVDLHTGPWRASDDDCDIFFDSSGSTTNDQNINQPSCPSLAIVYGYFDGNDTSKQTWTTLVCEQRLQQISTSLKLSSPSENILLDPKPTPDESTATYIESGSNGEKAFGWWLNNNMEYSFIIVNESAIDPVLQMGAYGEIAVSNDNPDFSNFFRGAFFGRTPLSLDMMKRNDTEAKATIFNHLNMFYRRYMAQYIAANLRIQPQTSAQLSKRDDNIISSSGPLTGSFTTDAGVPRLLQQRTPKIILQSMLAFMFVCAVAALWLGQYRNLVLWNPCTIAGVMVLFAGSKMCGPTDPKGSNRSEDDSIQADNDNARVNSDSSIQDDNSRIRHDNDNARGSNDSVQGDNRTPVGNGSLANDDSTPPGDEETDNQRAWRADAGHEMAALSSPRPSPWPLDSTHALLGSSEESLEAWNKENARFRLGWWQHGVYMGQMKGRKAVREGSGWRYGIDVI